jgi:hypothetical protein
MRLSVSTLALLIASGDVTAEIALDKLGNGRAAHAVRGRIVIAAPARVPAREIRGGLAFADGSTIAIGLNNGWAAL